MKHRPRNDIIVCPEPILSNPPSPCDRVFIGTTWVTDSSWSVLFQTPCLPVPPVSSNVHALDRAVELVGGRPVLFGGSMRSGDSSRLVALSRGLLPMTSPSGVQDPRGAGCHTAQGLDAFAMLVQDSWKRPLLGAPFSWFAAASPLLKSLNRVP